MLGRKEFNFKVTWIYVIFNQGMNQMSLVNYRNLEG